MPKRIDFNRFVADKRKDAGGGLISGDMRELLSEDPALQSVIKQVAPGVLIWWVSNGDWSMHELLLELLNITGPAEVFISSYAMSETPARVLAKLKEAGDIIKLHCVLDNRIDVRTAGSFQLMRSICDTMVLVDTHAKVTAIINDAWKIAVVGSANYTENKRYEAGVITTNPQAVDMQITWLKKALENGIVK